MKMHEHKGIALVEVLVGVAIASLVIVFVSHTITLFLLASEQTLDRTQAMYLAEEGQEVLRYIRDSDWNTLDGLTVGDTYYLLVATTTLATTTVPEIIGGTFTRSFVLGDIRRDNTSEDIVTSGGTVDVGSREVTVTVAWGTSSTSLTTILTNLHGI